MWGTSTFSKAVGTRGERANHLDDARWPPWPRRLKRKLPPRFSGNPSTHHPRHARRRTPWLVAWRNRDQLAAQNCGRRTIRAVLAAAAHALAYAQPYIGRLKPFQPELGLIRFGQGFLFGNGGDRQIVMRVGVYFLVDSGEQGVLIWSQQTRPRGLTVGAKPMARSTLKICVFAWPLVLG